MSGMNELEREIEESRARLDETIDRIQDRLTVPNLVDEMIGNARRTPLSEVYDSALETVRRNPVPVLLIAAGVGWLMRRMATETKSHALRREAEAAARVPVLTTGADRVYDPDRPTRRPGAAAGEETQT
ncbi:MULTISPECIES: DUF3618 domain-containing protein [Methylobacterium]|uniref:DUF3618 domain-containing protein n=3 Tax=Pseudomonadota TaxID=1224 RepID=A0ABQ4SW58_9HYPH|nr:MULTISPECIES: DUF3618 domain-containing protein [Methylobacterium]PIU08271.1 MAG: hypothetical protein COT56_02085 [Methylobacterium sp. CG09_land_8_20_14_0_10_71_15]PIU12875.1 MAG: hypothetical protein COT28_13660 [Methylobacterium sp. CG08_land_8_20_14_0_20_71_15]GBU17535.1 hypothetical protein AwMethylo_17500 [Methylobacterium sp.]GJE07117.1 hypothetical protein AOPFMNJM_2441 [Methylobacterium jeotgali]